MTPLAFTVPGLIRGKQRAGRKRLADGSVLSFNPPETAASEKLVRDYAVVQMRRQPPFTGPVRLSICIYKTVPKKWSAKRKIADFAVGRPDLDNVAKTIGDALQSIAFSNDLQIADLRVQRRYGEVERTSIEITPLEEDIA